MKTQKRSGGAAERRQAVAGDTSVVVVEEAGVLTAIVVDKIRGVNYIPLGSVDPPKPSYS